MIVTRETLYAALFAKVAAATWTPVSPFTATTWVTSSRKLLHWSDVLAENCPALFQTQDNQDAQQQQRMPGKWTLKAALYVYVRTQAQMDAAAIPAQYMNPILDAIETALAPAPGPLNTQTLGGLVSHCWITSIETSEGLFGDLEVAKLNVEMLVPSLT